MYRITAGIICCLFVFGTLAATASAAATATWAPMGSAGESLSPQMFEGSSYGDGIPRGSNANTRGLSFMRASTNPTWIVDVMREFIPWSLGGRAVVSASVTGRTMFAGGRRGGASAVTYRRPESGVRVSSVDDYSDRWSSWRLAEPTAAGFERYDVSELEQADSGSGLDGSYQKSDRVDLSSPEQQDDRAGDRYYDAR